MAAYRFYRLVVWNTASIAKTTVSGSGRICIADMRFRIAGSSPEAWVPGIMTAQDAPEPLVGSQSNASPPWLAWRTFDSDPNGSGWLTAPLSLYLGQLPQWIQIDLGAGNEVEVDLMSMRPSANTGNLPHTPQDFQLFGSNTGEFAGEEVLLHESVGVTWSTANETKYFTVESPADLSPASLAAGVPILGAPAVSQIHVLGPAGLVAGQPVLGQPTATSQLVAEGVVAGAPVIGQPALAQVHALLPADLVAGTPDLGEPLLPPAGLYEALYQVLSDDGAAADIGDRARLQCVFTDANGAPTDPDEVRFLMRTPSGQVATYVYGQDPQVSRLSPGTYAMAWDVTEAGAHWWRCEGRGRSQGAEEARLLIRPSRVLG